MCTQCISLQHTLDEFRAAFLAEDYEPPHAYKLTRTEVAIYALLHKRRGQTTRHSQIFLASRQHGLTRSEDYSVIRAHICNIRRKLRRVGGPEIVTVRGAGFRLLDA